LTCGHCGYRGVRIDGIPLLLPQGAPARYRDSEWFVARVGPSWRARLRTLGARRFARLVRRATPAFSRRRVPVTPRERARAATHVARLRPAGRRDAGAAAAPTPTRDPIAWLSAAVARSAGRRARVLDVGSGGGFLFRDLLRTTTADVTAIDIDFLCLRTTQRQIGHRRARARVIGADLRALPFPDASFDIVTSNFALSHVLGVRDGLAEIHRVLRPGGRLLACETEYRWLIEGWPPRRCAALARAVGLHGGSRSLVAALRRAGFQVRRDRAQRDPDHFCVTARAVRRSSVRGG
jgi:SAM-dependent methyltransferase